MQIIAFDATSVKIYHTIPGNAGTRNFEHIATVPLADILASMRADGRPKPDLLKIACPIAGCRYRAWVPLTGGADAQTLHAYHRAADQKISLADATASVARDVAARGFIVRVLEAG